MIRTYQKKPVQVEAVQFKDNYEEIEKFTRGSFRLVGEEDRGDDPDVIAEVFDYLHNTWVGVKEGQYIIKGVTGEFYPCAPAVFDATYELVNWEHARSPDN